MEAIPRRLWHRLPWLALGLGGAMLSAAIVASFEEELRAEVLLAFFLPAVVYMADAVGTQTETVVIRGMSLGVPIGRIAVRELLTGMIIGTLIAAAFFVFALVVWESTRVAAVVSLSLFVSTSLATAVAMSAPVRAGETRARPGVWLGAARDGDPGPPLDRRLLRHRRPAPSLIAFARKSVRLLRNDARENPDFAAARRDEAHGYDDRRLVELASPGCGASP